ncbi:hypothetical protein [Microbulbifer taiwanensis]|uniref:hypothetical protein n=1 Tax=Microbulbifer taiwanensis TaxID=986746 RepID=UPI00360F66FF
MKKKQTKTSSKPGKRLWRAFFGATFLLLLAAAAALWALRTALVEPLAVDEDGLRFEVTSGSNLSRALRDLQKEGVVRWPRLVLAYAYWQGKPAYTPGNIFCPGALMQWTWWPASIAVTSPAIALPW